MSHLARNFPGLTSAVNSRAGLKASRRLSRPRPPEHNKGIIILLPACCKDDKQIRAEVLFTEKAARCKGWSVGLRLYYLASDSCFSMETR